MFKTRRNWTAPALLAVSVLLGACSGGGSGPAGSVSLGLTDTPVDTAQKVVISVTGVAFKPAGGGPEVIENFQPRSIDLLQYQNGKTAILLQNTPMDPGRYQWIRLIINAVPNVQDSYIQLNTGEQCELNVPSGAETGLKMIQPIDVPTQGSLALTVDFNVQKSVHMPGGPSADACAAGYILRPTLRLVNDANAGAIDGTITFTGGEPTDCAPKVYVWTGTVTPDDMPDLEPFGVAMPDVTSDGLSATYTMAFVPPGEYTAAFTCDSDDPDTAETLEFVPVDGIPVTVQNNVISTVDFTYPPPAP
jgi:hypothetical protein